MKDYVGYTETDSTAKVLRNSGDGVAEYRRSVADLRRSAGSPMEDLAITLLT